MIVERFVNSKGSTEPAGSTGDQVRRRGSAPLAHTLNAGLRRQCPDQDRPRVPILMRDDVEAVVHPIDQIHIGVPHRAEHSGGPPARPPIGMGCGVVLRTISFSLDDPAGKQLTVDTTDKPLAQQAAGDK